MKKKLTHHSEYDKVIQKIYLYGLTDKKKSVNGK